MHPTHDASFVAGIEVGVNTILTGEVAAAARVIDPISVITLGIGVASITTIAVASITVLHRAIVWRPTGGTREGEF